MIKERLQFRDRPLVLYLIIVLAIIAAGLLWRFHADFEIDITIELLGAIITIIIIDELLLRSKRKRWNLVRDEIEYTLGRTVNIIRDDLLRKLFSFKPKMDTKKKDLDGIEHSVRKQKDRLYKKYLEMDPEELFERMDDDYLKEGYDDYFLEQAESVWSILNSKHSEHFNPELVEELIKLNLHLRDLHSNIRFYKRGEDESGRRGYYYEEKGEDRVAFTTKKIIENLIKLKEMGYSVVPSDR